VPLLALAGVTLACALLPELAALRRPYGMLLCVKALLFAALLALAALNRQRLTPALARGEAWALPVLRRSLSAEYLLLGMALIATAALSGFFSPTD
jgi:putative copper export protein